MNGKQDSKGKHKTGSLQGKVKAENCKGKIDLNVMNQVMTLLRWVLTFAIVGVLLYGMGILLEIKKTVTTIKMQINAMEAEGKAPEGIRLKGDD